MSKNKRQVKKFGPKTMLTIAGIVLIGAAAVYFAFMSMIPVNGKVPVLGFAENTYLVSSHDSQAGYVFASKGTTGGKKSFGSSHVSPTIHVTKDQLSSIHLINDDAGAKHNLNIDEFNVHTKDLNYFETQTTTFIADKSGTYKYYCSLHPEMKGDLIIE